MLLAWLVRMWIIDLCFGVCACMYSQSPNTKHSHELCIIIKYVGRCSRVASRAARVCVPLSMHSVWAFVRADITTSAWSDHVLLFIMHLPTRRQKTMPGGCTAEEAIDTFSRATAKFVCRQHLVYSCNVIHFLCHTQGVIRPDFYAFVVSFCARATFLAIAYMPLTC